MIKAAAANADSDQLAPGSRIEQLFRGQIVGLATQKGEANSYQLFGRCAKVLDTMSSVIARVRIAAV